MTEVVWGRRRPGRPGSAPTAGASGLRQFRIVRLAHEALDQGAVATQEDLRRGFMSRCAPSSATVLTSKRKGVRYPPGQRAGPGRGQTHKAQIVKRWLHGDTYDQISLHTRHSLSSIRRYVQTFVRVVHCIAGVSPNIR